MTLYEILIFIHILAAILGMGPGFVMTFIIDRATTMTELRHGFALRRRIHMFIIVGAVLLLVTGIGMALINTALLHQGWYILSLILFFAILAAGPLLLRPLMTPIKVILRTHKSEAIPAEYKQLSKKLFIVEHATNVLIIVIIVLMVLKPF
ncbi:hypothetical protein JNUCC1_02209 [Lentibacillus sp. JNUCC-1]|uniref:DUF2269 family protein n=1 Tax=Lentibacillus sp. JNUCC-1 TaxID=2654513 RepID=UPI0012E94148|nr:DUF2269 family protein [Lentibacillus sp. JNUCC-1]MUV38371.1 hypothetical protein [Lentibacillus sp. JNUCC-1]